MTRPESITERKHPIGLFDELRATVNSAGRMIYRGTAVVNAGGGSRNRIEHVE